jgi:hypothetical protein
MGRMLQLFIPISLNGINAHDVMTSFGDSKDDLME